LAIAYRKLPKYAKQVLSMIPENKVAELEVKVNQPVTA
jgi:hypothetical protein